MTAPAMCHLCDDVPVFGKRRTCDGCKVDAHRLRNRAYEERRRDAGIVERAEDVAARLRREKCERELRFDALLIRFAERHSRVPTLLETSIALDIAWSMGTKTQRHRQRAFGIRRFTPSEAGRREHIPYPVPESWKA